MCSTSTHSALDVNIARSLPLPGRLEQLHANSYRPKTGTSGEPRGHRTNRSQYAALLLIAHCVQRCYSYCALWIDIALRLPLPRQAKLDDGSLVRLLSAWVDLSATREMNAEVRPARLFDSVRRGVTAERRPARLFDSVRGVVTAKRQNSWTGNGQPAGAGTA